MHLFSSFALIIPTLFPIVHSRFTFDSPAAEFVEVSPRYLVRIEEDNSLVPFPSGRNGEIRFSGIEAGGTEIRMLTTFFVPTISDYHRCVLTFNLPENPTGTPTSQISSVVGSGIFEVYHIGEIIVGRTSFQTRPLRKPAFPVFTVEASLDMAVTNDAGSGNVTGEPIPVEPGQRLDFELVATRDVGSTDIIFYEKDGKPTDDGGVGIRCFD